MIKATILLCGPPLSALGGGPTHMRNLMASALSERYRIVHFETGSRGTESPARDEGVLAKALRFVTSPVALALSIARFRPAVVHLNSAVDQKAFWRDLVYLAISKLFGRRVVFQLHGGSLTALCRARAMRRVARAAYSIPDALVLLAESEKREFGQLGVSGRLSIIPNGVNVEQFSGPEDRMHSGRIRRLAFMGRLIRPKGMFEAMEAIRILRADESFRDVELWIAGSGPAKDEIASWSRAHGMDGCIKLVGSVYGRDKVEFFRGADVFVFPTYHLEGLPYAILESLAAGTPVIASRVAGIPDVVGDRIHGRLIDAKDPRQIVDAVHELSRSEADLQAMSRRCSSWARQQLGLERLASQFEGLYEDMRAR